MTTTAPGTSPATVLPTGAWRVVPGAGRAEFGARGMFGLARVRGAFTSFRGTLVVTAAEAHGELLIDSASLDTKNARRDEHLRSADFFDVENHPTVRFGLAGLAPQADGTFSLTGLLTVKDTPLRITAPVTASLRPDGRLELATSLTVDRAEAGVGWSKMGMVRGRAHLDVTAVLEPDTA